MKEPTTCPYTKTCPESMTRTKVYHVGYGVGVRMLMCDNKLYTDCETYADNYRTDTNNAVQTLLDSGELELKIDEETGIASLTVRRDDH